MEHKHNELRKQIRDAFVDDEKSGMFPTVDWVMNYLITQGRIVQDGYVAVPKEPTYEMNNAGKLAAFEYCDGDEDLEEYAADNDECALIYKAMLAAAQKGNDRDRARGAENTSVAQKKAPAHRKEARNEDL